MEREYISKNEQIRDGLLIALSGGVIGIIAVIAGENILSFPNPDTDMVIWAGGLTLIGASLALNGVVRYKTAKNTSEKGGE